MATTQVPSFPVSLFHYLHFSSSITCGHRAIFSFYSPPCVISWHGCPLSILPHGLIKVAACYLGWPSSHVDWTCLCAASFTGALISYAIVCQSVISLLSLVNVLHSLPDLRKSLGVSVLKHDGLSSHPCYRFPNPILPTSNALCSTRYDNSIYIWSQERLNFPSECSVLFARVLLVVLQTYCKCVLTHQFP